MTNLPLSDAITSLRQELKAAVKTSDPELPLHVKELELELTLQVNDERGAEAGVSVWSVVTGRVNAKESDSRLHRLRIVLNPQTLDADGESHNAKLSSEF